MNVAYIIEFDGKKIVYKNVREITCNEIDMKILTADKTQNTIHIHPRCTIKYFKCYWNDCNL